MRFLGVLLQEKLQIFSTIELQSIFTRSVAPINKGLGTALFMSGIKLLHRKPMPLTDFSTRLPRASLPMQLRALKNKKLWVAAAGVCFAVTYIVFAWAARNEIFYLCGNFKKGISYASVVRQMETSNLSVHLTEELERETHIHQTSVLHLHLLQCRVEFDQEQQSVVESEYGWDW